uniref:Ada DNA repair metal-binding domain-containing protein n=1 Tax=Dictyoglomus thermophilum TaxID=14 RepID=A0A7C3RIG1_DICTH
MTKVRRGFSSLEILIVISILFILVSLALPLYFNTIEEAKRDTQHNNMQLITKEIEIFAIKYGRYPNLNELQDLLSKFFEYPISPYNDKHYTFTSDITYFRNAFKNDNFKNAHIIFYAYEEKAYTIFYYPPKFYVGNKGTKKFHYPWCWTLPSPQNQTFLKTRNEAVENGYSPCGNCLP